VRGGQSAPSFYALDISKSAKKKKKGTKLLIVLSHLNDIIKIKNFSLRVGDESAHRRFSPENDKSKKRVSGPSVHRR
jgi:hypothetical protein